MPNWCENKLTVRGKYEDVVNFVDKYVTKERGVDGVSFQKVIPMPDCLNVESSSRQKDAIEWYLSESNPSRKSLPYASKHPLLSKQEFNMFVSAIKKVSGSIIAMSNVNACSGKYNLSQDFLNKSSEELEEYYNLGKTFVENAYHYGTLDWYHWRCSNWGTKWEADYLDCSGVERFLDNSAEIIFYFDTAWSPPEPLVDTLIDRHPELEITLDYFEEGCWFAGEISSNGSYACDDSEIRQFSIDKLGYDQDYWNDIDAMNSDDDDDES